ncbi:MAG: translocation/assembly module TamB domain-containing protein [Candidatus Binatia bacterium]
MRDLDRPGWTLTSLWRGEQADLGGTVRATASLSGPARALSGSARVSADELVVGGRALGTLQVDVRAERGRWRASTALLDGALRVDADVRPDPGLPFAIESAWQQADAARLLGAPPELHLTSSGSLRVSGRLDAVERFDARVDVTELALTGGVKAVTADVPVNVICRQGRCSLDRLTLRSGEAALRLGGEAGVDGRVRLTLAGGGTLALLELVGEPIESARGTFAVDATISHGPSGWSLRGAVDLDKVALDAGLPVAVTRGGGRLVLDGEVIRIEGLQGRIGTGRFAIGGQIDLRQGPAVTWTLSDVGADPLPSLEVELSGQGTVDGTWQALRVAGAIHIGQLLYDRNLALTDFLPTFNRALAAAPRPRGEREVHLALTVEAPGQLYIENNLARMEARARLSIGGTAARPVIDGRVEALDGEVFLRGRTFELLGATVDFRPDLGMAAALNLTAESLIETSDGAYVVGVRVTGTTAEPRVVLTSDDPGLSQTDIATLIAFGRTTAQMRRQGGSFSLTGVLGFGTEQVGDLLAGEAERVLPVDRIEFEPTFSTTTGAFEPQLTIGKDLTDNLSASVGQTFGVSSRTRVEVEYRLGPRVSVPLLWETQTEAEAGAFGGGVRLRYEFWRLTPWTLLSGLR